MNYQLFITSVLQEASVIANDMFGKVFATVKGDDNNQVLTEADLAIGKLIVDRIKKAYSDYNVIDEEAGVIDCGSAFTWVVDPIDGTSNFANGIETYGIMIGLLKEGSPIAGGFSLPAIHKTVIAEKGKGAFEDGKPLKVTQETHLNNCLVAYHIDGHPEDPKRAERETEVFGEIIKHCRNMRNTGCEPWDGLLVAQGKYGALVNQSMKIWDAVAVQIIIEEAGGVYTDFWGNKIDYTKPLTRIKQNFTCCASAPSLHKQLQTLIHKSSK